MPVNTLTTSVIARSGSIVLETMVNHYFDRLKREFGSKENDKTTNLKNEEMLYHQAFNVIKVGLSSILGYFVMLIRIARHFSKLRASECGTLVSCDFVFELLDVSQPYSRGSPRYVTLNMFHLATP